MIKTFEQYQNHNRDLVRYVWKKILSDKKEINGYYCQSEMSGSIMWQGEYYGMYATPYWELSDNLPIDIFDINYETIESMEIEREPLKDLKDADNFVKWYYIQIDKITKKLNKRFEIVKTLKSIYNNLPQYIKDKLIYQADRFELKMTTDEIINVYSIIEKEYPELISATNYNL